MCWKIGRESFRSLLSQRAYLEADKESASPADFKSSDAGDP